MKQTRLSHKLIKYIIPIVVAPIIILGSFYFLSITNTLERQAEAIVIRNIEKQVTRIENYTTLYKSITDVLSLSPILETHLVNIGQQNDITTNELTKKQIDLIKEFGDYVNTFPNILSIGTISPKGKVESFFPKNFKLHRINYAFDEQIFNSEQEENIFFIEENGDISFYVTYKLFERRFSLDSAKFIGYLIIHIDNQEIEQSVADSYYSDSINFIMDSSGKILFSNQPEYLTKELSENELEQLKNLPSSDKFSELTLPSLTSEKRMVISNTMDNGLYLVHALNKNSYSNKEEVGIYIILLILFSLFFLIGLVYLVINRILVDPITSLASASNQLGNGDLEVRLAVDRNDEFGNLLQNFNQMAEQIKQYQHQLIDIREHLEEMVTKRTSALDKTNKKLEKAIIEAEQANHLKSRFLANMSHEIRTPLTAIIGFTESTLAQESDQNKAGHLNTILRNSEHLLELINNILDLSKIEADKFEFETRPVAVLTLISDIETIVKPLALNKQLAFSVDIDYPLPNIIHSDETRLKQILLNICSNAVKFTDEGQVTINLKYCKTSEKLIFTVADSGIGMTKQEQTRIFKPFEQADISTTRKFGGTGLGLCIAKNLAHILGGDISVKSEPNKGSQFVIEIATYNQGHHITMLTRSQLTKTTTTEQLADTSQHLKGRILVAEDNVDNQELIKLLLSQWDIKVEFANNGVEAVEKALFSDFDLILMDMQMPVMGGLEATQLLRRAAYTGPIVALTANVMKNDTAAYLAAGCNKTLAKPINRQHFEQVLNQYLSLKMEHEWPQVLSAQTCYLEEISKNYKTKLPNLLAQITQLHNQQNHKELVDVAHSIKGSAGSFGFSEITQAAAELETSIRNNSDDKINDSVLELMKEIELGIES